MKTLEVIRKMDGFEKRLADLTKEYNAFKEEVDGKQKESNKVDSPKLNSKKSKK
jgi:hypothetical protein